MNREEAIEMWVIPALKNTWNEKRCNEVLEALEQEPCEDAISKQAAIDQTYLWSRNEFLRVTNPFDYLRKRINSLPSVTPAEKVGKWIPVSERLPDLDDYDGSRVWQKKVLITGYLSFDDTKELFVSEAFAEDVVYNSVHDTVVTAWMPLPEPYKASPTGAEGSDKE